MKFDELDAKMRVFETAHDHCALPGLFLVARLDGRRFTRLTKELLAFEAPFDVVFRDTMVAVTQHVMQCGIDCVYGYTQSDEISLLLHPATQAFHRKERKLNSVLAGEASGVASLHFQRPVAFDCRISQLPTAALVVDYFRWRHEDAGRNALNGHCYWRLRGEGCTPELANDRLAGMSTAAKNEFLFERGVNFNTVPAWQKRGLGVSWRQVLVEGRDPRTDTVVQATRRRLMVDDELPMGDEYSAYVGRLLTPV
jgi:tRNA(His) 5'-end guanylyltransferase